MRLILFVGCLLATLPAWGGGGVLVVGDANRPYFRDFSSSLAASLKEADIEVAVVDTEKYRDLSFPNGTYRCVVTVGNDAARKLSATPSALPLLHALVTESFTHNLYVSPGNQAPHIFLVIDQPIRRLIWLARISMPDRHKLDVIYGPYSRRYQSEVHKQADNAGFLLTEKEITAPEQLADAMAALKGRNDVLLTLPDPTVVSEGTAKTLILGAYLDNLPLVGFSQALVKAGALMSVHTTPEQLGAQAAEMIIGAFWSDTDRKGMLIYPRYYQVSVNYQVANALQIELPSESVLKARLERMDEMR